MILVTGASGLLGANFLQVASNSGREVSGTYHRFPMQSSDTTVFQADITKRAEIENIFRHIRPTYVLHCAALTNVDKCETHPEEAWQINVVASRWLAQAAREFSARFIFISTDSVFDGIMGNYSESDIPNPINAYARSKLAAEEAVLECSTENLVIRTNIFGWNMQDKLSLAEWMLLQLESGSRLSGFVDVVFSPILVNDLSRIILTMIDHGLTGVHHVSGSQAISKYDFALELADVFSLDPNLVDATSINDIALAATRPRNTSLQVKSIEAILGISMPSVRSGILRFKTLRENEYDTTLKTRLGG